MSETDSETAEWTPPGDHDWGEGTRQARQARGDNSGPGWWTDAYEMRMRFGVPAFDREAFDRELYVDTLIHEKPAETTNSAGGTDWLKVGERGCGKSTDNLNWSLRLMEVNDEIVIWRGSPARSEWLPLRDWTTLWLPANASVDANWMSEVDEAAAAEADLEDVVRDVRRYEGVRDLLDQLGDQARGTFNVVYPDPSFAGCRELTRKTNRVSETLPFVPQWETFGDESGTPLTHWWVAFILGRVEHGLGGSFWWTSLMFDESGDLIPEGAEEDEHSTYKKLKLVRSCYADSRRSKFSLYWSAHREDNIHHKISKEVMRRVQMPDETPNPRQNRVRSIPKGFKTVPMFTDIMSNRKVGTALMFNQNEFVLYRWDDIASPYDEDAHRWLKLELGEPDEDSKADAKESDGPTLRYDSSIFKKWIGGPDDTRLYARDPGDGYVDVQTGHEAEALSSPVDGMEFCGVEHGDDVHKVKMRDESDSEVVVAEIPVQEVGLEASSTDDDADPEVAHG